MPMLVRGHRAPDRRRIVTDANPASGPAICLRALRPGEVRAAFPGTAPRGAGMPAAPRPLLQSVEGERQMPVRRRHPPATAPVGRARFFAAWAIRRGGRLARCGGWGRGSPGLPCAGSSTTAVSPSGCDGSLPSGSDRGPYSSHVKIGPKELQPRRQAENIPKAATNSEHSPNRNHSCEPGQPPKEGRTLRKSSRPRLTRRCKQPTTEALAKAL